MSMDEQYQQMIRFNQALSQFNERLSASMRELEEKHELVSPLWQDEMRKSYDAEWLPMHERMTNYVRSESRHYTDFLTMKIRLLERYLRGV